MKKYLVRIVKTYEKYVEVFADDADEALDIVEHKVIFGDVSIDCDDYSKTEYEIVD